MRVGTPMSFKPDRLRAGVASADRWRAIAKWSRRFWPLNAVVAHVLRLVFGAVRQPVPKAIVTHWPRTGTVRVQTPSGRALKLWSRGDDWISTQLFWRGLKGYEPETAPLFYGLARHARTVVDVGAYVGYFSILAALAGAERVVAIEPSPETFARLERNVRLNEVSVTCHNLAISRSPGLAALHHLPSGFSSAASLNPDHLAVHDVVTTTVRTETLDRVLGDDYSVDLLKIDVETLEPDVLGGAVDLLSRDRPDVVCEILNATVGEQVSQQMRPLGYRFFDLTAHGPVPAESVAPSGANYLLSARLLSAEAVAARYAWPL